MYIYTSLYIVEPYTYLVQEILRQSVSIRSVLQLDNIAVVFDQALYERQQKWHECIQNSMGH